MHSPATAMIWELWRLTRKELLFLVALLILGGAALLTIGEQVGEESTMATLFLFASALICLNSPWSWTRKIDNGVGFLFNLGYVRPIPTWLLVCIPLAYLGVSVAVAYLVTVGALNVFFGIGFPLIPVAVTIGVAAIIFTSCYWWTANRAIQMTGVYAALAGVIFLYRWVHPESLPGNDFPPERWPIMFAFSFLDYVVLLVGAGIAIAITIFGVEHQRHGDESVFFYENGGKAVSYTNLSGWFAARVNGIVRVSCPTDSPVRAQWWFEMRTVGLDVLATGALGVVAIPVLLAVGNILDWDTVILLVMVSPFLVLSTGISRLLGVQKKPGHTYLGVYNATRSMGIAELFTLKLSVAVICVLVAWAFLAASFWVSTPLFSDVADFTDDKQHVISTLGSLGAGGIAFWALFGVIQVATMISYTAAFHAFYILHSKRALVVGLSVVAYFLGLSVAMNQEIIPDWFPVMNTHLVLIAAVVVLGTVASLKIGFRDSIFSAKQIRVALVSWLLFAAVCFAILDWNLISSDVPIALAVFFVASLTLVPLLAAVVAPWAYSCLRSR
jgi:hypothetical protein